MTLTLEISPDDQRVLEVAAQAEGHSINDYAALLLHRIAQEQRSAAARRMEMLERWEQEIATRPNQRALAGLGPLPDDAIEDVYREREYAQ